MSTKFKCFLCDKGYVYSNKNSLVDHLNTAHEMELFNLPAEQVYFNFKNRYPLNRSKGKSVIYKKPTNWNPTSQRYERFHNEAESLAYRKQFIERMQKTYGKTHLLDDPDTQKKMLAKRKISGEYTFKDGSVKGYTGSYEKDFLKKMDTVFNWRGIDIVSPAPKHLYYKDENNKERFYIPDFFIASLNLLVEIKSAENNHYRKRDIRRERLKDDAAMKSGMNFIKIYDKDYTDFFEYLLMIRTSYPNDS